jgi:adenylate kinase family enzyme
MRRVLVIGCPGAGKSTLAAKLAAHTGLPLIQLDRLYWSRGWQPAETSAWRRRVSELAAAPAWIIDGNYPGTFDVRLPRADTLIWLDYPRARCLRRLIWRMLRHHGRTRPELPDGCDERLDFVLLRQVWEFPAAHRPHIVQAIAQTGAHLQVVQCRHDRDADAFLIRMGAK